MRWEHHLSLQLMNSFNKTDAAIYPMQAMLPFLRLIRFLDFLLTMKNDAIYLYYIFIC